MKILKRNLFHTVYYYKANLHFANDESRQIIVLHSCNMVTALEKKAKCRKLIHT
jgi:hypothetical protein